MDKGQFGGSRRITYLLAGCGLAFLIATAALAIFSPNVWSSLQVYGYLGAFLISVAGGATIIIPIPMLPVVAALGAALHWLGCWIPRSLLRGGKQPRSF